MAEGAGVKAFDFRASNSARVFLPASVALVDSPESAARRAQARLLLKEWADFVDADWAATAAQMRLPKFLFDGRNPLDAE